MLLSDDTSKASGSQRAVPPQESLPSGSSVPSTLDKVPAPASKAPAAESVVPSEKPSAEAVLKKTRKSLEGGLNSGALAQQLQETAPKVPVADSAPKAPAAESNVVPSDKPSADAVLKKTRKSLEGGLNSGALAQKLEATAPKV